MNQVEKELNDSTPVEAGLPNDNSPCPRQLSMESAEKINGEIGNPCDDEIGKPGDSTEEPAEPEKIDLPEKQATLESNVVDEELSSLPAPTPNGDVGSDVGDNKNSAAQPVQQAKKNKAKKKNKKWAWDSSMRFLKSRTHLVACFLRDLNGSRWFKNV